MPLSADLADSIRGSPFQGIWRHLTSDDTLYPYIVKMFWRLADAVCVLRAIPDVELRGFFEYCREDLVREIIDGQRHSLLSVCETDRSGPENSGYLGDMVVG